MSTGPTKPTETHLAPLGEASWNELEQLTSRFESAWQAGNHLPIESVLPSSGRRRWAALVELCHVELEFRIKDGEPASAQEYLDRYPALATDTDVASDLILSEYSIKRQYGIPIGREALIQQYLDYERAIRSRLDIDDPSPAATDAAGQRTQTTRLERFELLERVGRGAFADVFRARDTELNRTVAVKILRFAMFATDSQKRDFLREAQSAARLIHPAIVPLYDAGQSDGICFLVSEFVEGETLSQWRQHEQPNFRHAATLIEQIANALHYAHSGGVVHRDVKPENIMLDAAGRPRLMDFGLASCESAEITLTLDDRLLGTPAYMSPEQASGSVRQIDGRSDVYSLGVTLYQLLAGELPFQGSSQSVLEQIRSQDPKPLRLLDQKIPHDLEVICQKAMEKLPARRYETADHLARDLNRYLAGEPIHARPVSFGERAVKWSRRRPAVAAMIGLGTLTILLALAAGIWHTVTLQRALDDANLMRNRSNLASEQAAQMERLAAQREQQARALLYNADIKLAHQALKNDDVSQAIDLLQRYKPQQEKEADRRDFCWHYLWHLSHANIESVHAHDAPIYAVAYSPDRVFFATASKDHTAKLWRTADNSLHAVLKGHANEVNGLAFSPDGRRLATVSNDKTVRLWDVESAELVATLEGHEEIVFSVAFSPDGLQLATGGKDRVLQIWDVETAQSLARLEGHAGAIESLAYSPDGQSLATASGDRTVRLWNLKNDTSQTIFTHPRALLVSVAFSPDGKYLATGCEDSSITMIEVATGRILWTNNNHTEVVQSVAFSPDGRLLASAGKNGVARICDTTTGENLNTFRGHLGRIWSIAFRSKNLVTSSGSDGTVKTWDIAGRSNSQLTTVFKEPFIANSFSPVDDLLAVATFPNVISISVFPYTTRQAKILDNSITLLRIVYSPDGQRLLAVHSDGKISILRASDLSPMIDTFYTDDPITCVVFAPDGKTFATGDGHGITQIWNSATGKKENTRLVNPDSVTSLAYSLDGAQLLTGSYDSFARIWDVVTDEKLASLAGHRGGIEAVAYSLDGKIFATASRDRSVMLWRSSDYALLATLQGHTSGVHHLVFCPDGKCLASATRNGEIRFWDLGTYQPLLVLNTPPGELSSLGFSRDAQQLIAFGNSPDGRGRTDIWHAPQDEVTPGHIPTMSE